MKVYAVILIAISVVAFGVFSLNDRMWSSDAETIQEEAEIEEQRSTTTQTKQAGEVEVEATPIMLSSDEEATIELSLNTHSVDLDYDYKEISYLEDDLGNKYKALEWSGEVGGHHLGGTLIFEKLAKNVQSVTLNISGIDEQDVSFEWDLKNK